MRTATRKPIIALVSCGLLAALCSACQDKTAQPQVVAEKKVATAELKITAATFGCLKNMTKVRHFFVDNLLGDTEATVAVANSATGGVYPPGSVVQLVPTEAMVKHPPGWNAATRDWEFFELDVSADGSTMRNRGFVDVVNKFGGNCFD